MTTKKTTASKPILTPKKDVLTEAPIVTSVINQSELDRLTKEKEESDKKFTELQAQMQLLMQQVSMMGNTNTTISVAEEVEVGCRLFSGGAVCNRTEDILYRFKYGEIKEIPVDELKECFRNQINNYRDLFAKGVFYFLNEKYYNEFKIRERLDLSEETLIDLLVNKRISVPYKEHMMVNGHRENNVYLTVLYIIADLYLQGKLSTWDFTQKREFEIYFGKRIDDVASMVSVLKQ